MKWKRVEEEIPYCGEQVLVYNGGIGTAVLEESTEEICHFWETDDTNICNAYGELASPITHWCRLPSPPK